MNEGHSEEAFERSSKIGRLEELNGHGGLTGKLREANGTIWTCYFKPDHMPLLPEAWMHTVKITGQTIMGGSKEAIVKVESISILDEAGSGTAEQVEESSFWTPLSLD
jgi:hypothetical protein